MDWSRPSAVSFRNTLNSLKQKKWQTISIKSDTVIDPVMIETKDLTLLLI